MDTEENTRDIKIHVALATDIDEMAELLGNIFSDREPPAVAAGFTAIQIEELVQVFGRKAAREKLGLVARSEKNGEMVGALLAHDFGVPPPDEIEPLVPIFEPLLAFLDQLEEKYRTTRTIVEGEFLHVFMIGVCNDWSGKRIAQKMVQRCIRNGANCGYNVAFTEATSEVSRRVFKNVGFQEQFFEKYEDFEFHQKLPFESIKEHEGCALMDMKIT